MAAKSLVSRPLVSGLLALTLGGCVALPQSYQAYHHSFVSGKIVDDKTSSPLSGVRVTMAGKTVLTDKKGMFIFVPEKVHHSWAYYPIIPIDHKGNCYDQIKISARSPTVRYREAQVEVVSCRNSYGTDENKRALEISDNLGTIRLLRRDGKGGNDGENGAKEKAAAKKTAQQLLEASKRNNGYAPRVRRDYIY